MNSGRHILSQILDLVDRKTLSRLVQRYDAESRVRHFGCRQQLICMVFAQLTWREGLRDIATCLNPNSEVQFRIQAFGTTETLRTTEKTEFEEIGDKSLFRAFKYFSVNSVVLSISVVFRQVFLTQLRSSG